MLQNGSTTLAIYKIRPSLQVIGNNHHMTTMDENGKLDCTFTLVVRTMLNLTAPCVHSFKILNGLFMCTH